MDQDKVDSLMIDLEDSILRKNKGDMNVIALIRVEMAKGTPELKAAAKKLATIHLRRKLHRERMLYPEVGN